MTFPQVRLRRLRQTPWIRNLVAETTLSAQDLVWPVFIREEEDSEEISSMPGVNRLTLKDLKSAAQRASDLGIPVIALFPYTPAHKRCPQGSEALNPDNLVCRAIQIIKEAAPQIGVMADVALDPYTTHGHDGVIKSNTVDNDSTLSILRQQALNQVKAGADIIAPSDMMDGCVASIRDILDQNDFKDTLLLSYAAKYASSFYGPFRGAIGVKGLQHLPDKKTYQMNPKNVMEALREVDLDLQEGADMIMVKPGLPYLDVIKSVKDSFNVPVFAYQVSGEYAMIKAAALQGWIDAEKVMMESLVALKRAGATGIVTYAAPDIAQILKS